MKNIIWQTPLGNVGVHHLGEDIDSASHAQDLINSGRVPSDWLAALFDVTQFPEPPQECWRVANGTLIADASITPKPPAPIDQIRAIESARAVQDAFARKSRQDLLDRAIDSGLAKAAAKGLTYTREQVHAWAMANDSDYRVLWQAEDAIKRLRSAP